jgi:hypothetical protein
LFARQADAATSIDEAAKHGFPARVLAPHRAASRNGSGSLDGCTGSCIITRATGGRSSELTQSLGQCPHLANLLP